MGILTREIERAPCTVEISHKFESLHAHVRFNNGAVIYPGDEVTVQGPEIMAPSVRSYPRTAKRSSSALPSSNSSGPA